MLNEDLKELHKKIKKLNSINVFEGKYVVIFGAAAVAKVLKNCLLEYGIKIDAVIDNDKKKIGKVCLGLEVKKPDDLLKADVSNIVVIIYSVFYRDMEYQLLKMGLNKQQILNVGSNYFRSDESIYYYIKYSIFMLLGNKYYGQIMSKYQGNTTVFICPYTGTGDVYLVGLYFYQYLKRENINNYVFIVVNNACKKVAQIFNIHNIEVMTSKAVGKLIGARMFTEKLDSIVVLNDSWASVYTNPLQWIRGYKGLNFNEMFRNFVFDLSDNVEYEQPKYELNQKEVDKFFIENKLLHGRTVVLSPYSNTLFELPEEIWEGIALLFQKEGFTVCTNSCGPKEPPITGTVPVFFSLTQAKPILDIAGYFIGVRSGLCDIISGSSCKKVIFYEKDGYFYQSSTYEYFSLRKMGLTDEVLEIEYSYSDNNLNILQMVKKYCFYE